MTRVAAIDCGTNSIRLLIADVDVATQTLTDVVRIMTVVRLGQGVDKTGMLAVEALERTFAAADQYAALCAEHGVEHMRFVATSATRDAGNRDLFLDGIRARLGVTPEVVSGEEEATLSFRGAVSVMDADYPAPHLVVDLGGGSTEVVLGDSKPIAGWSMDVGCVRMSERHLRSDPPTEAQIAAAVEDVRAALDVTVAQVPLASTRTLVGLAGSITTVTAHALDLPGYDSAAINGARIPVPSVIDSCTVLLHASREQRSAMPFMHPGRVDVIGAGALVWREVVMRVRDEVAAAGGQLTHTVTSEHDILDGIAFSAAGRV